MTWQKKYRWNRTWGTELGLDGKPHEDYTGWDGDQNIGRIFFDQQTLKMGEWKWAGGMPAGAKGMLMPNSGWAPSSEVAARTVEEYWDRMKANSKGV